MPEPRVTLYLRLKPDLAAEIEADRVAFALPTTTAAADAILRAGLDARAASRGIGQREAAPTPPAAPAEPARLPSYAATFAAAARIVFGLRGNDFDAEAVAFRLEGVPGALPSDLPEVLRELCRLGLIEDLTAVAPRGPGRPRKPKYRVTAATKDEAARILAEAARRGAIGGRGEALIGMTPEREAEIAAERIPPELQREALRRGLEWERAEMAEIAGKPTTRADILANLPPERQAAIEARAAEAIQEASEAGEQGEPLPEDCDPLGLFSPPEPTASPVRAVMAHLLAHPETAFTAGEVADAVGIGIDEALKILRDMVEDDAVEKTRQTPSRTVYGLVKLR